MDDPLDDREHYDESVELCKKCGTRMVEVEAWNVFGPVSPIPQCPECGWNEWQV